MIEAVAQAYHLFDKGETVCPDSYFLRFPTRPENRIIALPASIESGLKVSGIKWIASYPSNVKNKLDRASATIILNSKDTGYPIACLEGSLISAYRTAASAALGAKLLHQTEGSIKCLAVIGAGLIAKTTVSLLQSLNWEIDKLIIIDLDLERAKHFRKKFPELNIETSTDISQIEGSDMMIFATSAIKPYVTTKQLFSSNPTVLHMSLRDICPNILLNSQNYVDNADHAVKADTSLHLAEKIVNNRTFVTGNIVELMDGKNNVDYSVPRVYAPFGMGILDVSIGYEIYRNCKDEDVLIINNFFPKPYTE